MIVASIPGRLRLKLPPGAHEQLTALQKVLCTWPGVTEIRANPSASSLIIHYDVGTLSQKMMEQRVIELAQAQLPPPAIPATAVQSPFVSGPSATSVRAPHRHSRVRKASWRRHLNRVAKTAALITLPLSIALVYAGKKRLHAITGWLFVASLATHVVIHRKNTFH